MVNSKSERLARRREQLVALADRQRAELTSYSQGVKGPLRVAEIVVGLANSLRRSPWLVAGLAFLLVRTPWRKLARYPKWAWRGWRILRLVRRWAG